MKILVFSDSHGSFSGIRRALSLHSDTDFVFFLGDGIREAEQIPATLPHLVGLYAVRGNCDLGTYDIPEELICEIAGKRFFLCHGYTRHVKATMYEMHAAAAEKKVDVALFGHTHLPYLSYFSEAERPYYLMNPGSISHASDGRSHYGIIQILNGSLLISNAVLP